MNKPNFYKQYDARWASYSYGGDTVGASGCGPSSVANAVSSLPKLKHSRANPRSAFKWMCRNNYFVPGAGTIHAGIPACLKAYGVKKVKASTNKAEVKKHLKANDYVVSLMLRGHWTSGGHFILPYYVKGNKVYISDSGSDAKSRQKANFDLFFSESYKHWIIPNTAQYGKSKKTKTSTIYIFYTTEKTPVRKGRGKKYGKKGYLPKYKKVRVHNHKGGWYQIYSGELKGGYIHKSHLSKYRGLASEWEALETVNVWNGYSKKNTKIIKTLAKGTIMESDKYRGYWIHLVDGGWVCTKTKNGKQAKRIK